MNIFCENGWIEILTAASFMTTWKLHLFQNDHVPTLFDTDADYVEADFSGYVGNVTVVWGMPFVNGSNQGELDSSQFNFTHNGGSTDNTIYGIYVTDLAGLLLFAERFDAPVLMNAAGSTIAYTPKFTMINQ